MPTALKYYKPQTTVKTTSKSTSFFQEEDFQEEDYHEEEKVISNPPSIHY